MKITQVTCLAAWLVAATQPALHAQNAPEIRGNPYLPVSGLLEWPSDRAASQPDLTEARSNRVYDLHMDMGDCRHLEFILSTAGNWHPALMDYWFDRFMRKQRPKSYLITTTPPVALEQHEEQYFGMGNVSLRCQPHIAVGPKALMEALQKAGITVGEPVPLFTTRGNVLLVQKGNPKNIRTLHDLGRSDVRTVTPHPEREGGSFRLYTNTIYAITYHAFGKEKADTLFSEIFNRNDSSWVAGQRIHHREVPELIARGEGDVGVIFYQLARYVCELFPDQFDMVPLGGGVQAPDPLPGNPQLTLYALRLTGELTERQASMREAFFEEIEKGKMDKYLRRHHLIPAER